MGIETARNPKIAPDMSKISAMVKPRLLVTKKVKGGGRAVVNGVNLKRVDDLFGYYAKLPKDGGPGTYEFEVFDPDGTEKDKWTIQLGEESETTTGFSNEGQSDMGLGFSSSAPGAPEPSPGDPTGLQPGKPTHIGNGYWLTLSPGDPTKGWLTTPSRQMIPWREGMDLPGTPYGVGSASSTPVNGHQNTTAGYPPMGGGDSTAQFYKDQMQDMEKRLERDEQRRSLKEIEDRFTKILEESNKRYEALIAKVAEPKGPSPETQALQARLDAAERSAEEARRRTEDQARDQRIQSEIQATNQRLETALRDLANNKPDPMATMMPTFISALEKASASTQTSLGEYVRSLTSQVMRPEQFFEIIRMAKDRGPEAALNKEYMEAMRGIFGMMQEVVKMQADMNPEQPLWANMLQQGFDKMGTLGQSYMSYRSEKEEQDRQERIWKATQAQQNPFATAPPSAPPQQPAQQTQAPPAQQPTPDEARAAAAAEYFGPQVVPDPPEGDEGVEQTAPTGEAPVQPDQVIPGAAASPLPPGRTTQEAYARLAQASVEEIREMIKHTNDSQFFGVVLQKVVELRHSVASGMEPKEVSDALFSAYEQLTALGGPPLPVVELFHVGQFQVLLERLLPQADPVYRTHVIDIVRERFQQAFSSGEADGAA